MSSALEVDVWYPSVADNACLQSVRGKDYEEIYCVYPWMKNLYMK